MWVPVAYTKGGWPVPALLPEPDDNDLVSQPCVWCDGSGFSGMALCGACNGKGWKSYATQRELRQQAWEDMAFFVDAERAGVSDRDCCPLCGRGGGHDEEPCPNEPVIVRVVDAVSGAETLLMEVG